jgi:AcrR family transcriptional regulator
MKNRKPRPYRQTARASAAEATGERILVSFLQRFRQQWLEEITLDAVAADAGVTVQTVIRRFGGKDQLLDAAADHLNREITGRRAGAAGDVLLGIDLVTHDYEVDGDLYWRMLAQEDRYPVLRPFCDRGRVGHREWVASVFHPWLEGLPSRAAAERLDSLVVATDVFVWKLLRRDLKRPVRAFKSTVTALIAGVLPAGAVPNPSETRS